MKLSDIVRDPQITSPFGIVRPFSRRPHAGIDVISKSGERFVRAPGEGLVVWQYNITSRDRSAATAVLDEKRSEWPLGWYFSDIYGMIVTWLDTHSNLALSFCHMEPFQTADIAQHNGILLWETRVREQNKYNVWREWYGNQSNPVRILRGTIIGVYSDVGSSLGAHVHIEARHMEVGEDSAEEWKVFDPTSVLEI